MNSDGGGDEAAVLAASDDMMNGVGDEAGLDDMVEDGTEYGRPTQAGTF
jgi:hypothetical protein